MQIPNKVVYVILHPYKRKWIKFIRYNNKRIIIKNISFPLIIKGNEIY